MNILGAELVRVVQSESHGLVHTVAHTVLRPLLFIMTALQESEFTDLHLDFAEVQ